MRGIYSISTTIDLDANGNPTRHVFDPNKEELLTSFALLHHFLGGRFLVNENGLVEKVGRQSIDGYSFVETIKFDPIISHTQLFRLVFITLLPEYVSENQGKYDGSFHLSGVGVITAKTYNFTFANGRIWMKVSPSS